MSPRKIATACAVILIGLAAGCGGQHEGSPGAETSGRPPDVWARDFCTALQTWDDGVQARTERMTYDLNHVAAPGDSITLSEAKQVRSLILEGLGDLVVLTDKAGEAMNAAGAPAVENGEALSSIFSEFVTDFRAATVDAREKARAWNVTDPDEFNQGAQEFAAAMRQFKTVFSEEAANKRFPYASPELREAFADEPACAGLAPEGG